MMMHHHQHHHQQHHHHHPQPQQQQSHPHSITPNMVLSSQSFPYQMAAVASSSASYSSSSAAGGAGPPSAVDSFSSSGSASPSLSLRTATAEDSLSTLGDNPRLLEGNGRTATTANGDQQQINLQIFVPELQMQKCLSVALHELVWDIKRRLFESLAQPLPQSFNFGLFLPPCDGRAGKFLLEDRPICDYPFHDCVPYVELKYKKRVYKMLRLDEKALRAAQSKTNLRKLAEAIQQKNAQKVERLCTQGLDPNYHDGHGETPLTMASGLPGSREVLVQLVGGGAHLDFRNTEGQTGMHKAAFLSMADNVRALLELGASPNYRDMIGLTPLYYNMLSTDSNPEVTEMLLAEAADLDVVDMHGNTALHQACKNGLSKHAEQLLFHGADMNARNVNGNTPLHVCAVNGRVDCAQVLLYRGADPTLANRQGQTPIHVAQIVGSQPVAEVIRGHSPHNIVPFREAPRLNPRRRLSSRQFSLNDAAAGGASMRRRSLSHCSSASTIASSGTMQTPSQQPHHPHHRFSAAVPTVHQQQQQQIGGPRISPSPSPSITSSTTDYGTLRRIPAETVQHQQPGFEPNISRILVIPRGPKGFGFILRGAKHVDSMQLDFRPTPAVPALQFFEGVDMQGMAMRAGLRPGDFLLEINGVDVRSASHEQVVELIHQSGDTITLKVITIQLDKLLDGQQQQQQQIYATGGNNHKGMAASSQTYATIGRRNHSVPRAMASSTLVNGNLPQAVPPPPQRNPSTTLSFGRAFGASTNGGAAQFSTADLPPPPVHSAQPNHHPHPMPSSSSSQHHNFPSSSPFLPPSTPSSSTNSQQQQQIRCASVKLSRTSAVRRISAAELEHLMVQQGSSSQQQQSIILGPEQPPPPQMGTNGGAGGGPRKFASVTEMKRRKQTGAAIDHRSNSIAIDGTNNNDGGGLYGTPLKNSTSSPDLHATNGRQHLLRPKTPPPPPPPGTVGRPTAIPPPEPSHQPIYASTIVIAQPQMTNTPPESIGTSSTATTLVPSESLNPRASASTSASGAPPPPPPPPPANFLLRLNQPSTSTTTTAAGNEAKQPKAQKDNNTNDGQKRPKTEGGTASPENPTGDCRGVSAEALRSVRLKPVTHARLEIAETKKPKSGEIGNTKEKAGKFPAPADFDLDLRSALAKRRSKVRGVEDGNESGNEGEQQKQQQKATECPSRGAKVVNIMIGEGGAGNGEKQQQQQQQEKTTMGTVVGRYNGGLSLRESVLENVSGAAAKSAQSGCAAHKTTGTNGCSSHSPPGGFIGTKKDSGYTSSRTSLEPSECGDCCGDHQQQQANANANHSHQQHQQPIGLPVQHRVNVISQQLMDQHHKQMHKLESPSSNKLVPSSVSSSSVSPLPPSASAVVPPLVRIPPIDYDQSEEGSSQTSTDSGNQTDLEQASTLGESSSIVIVLEEQQQQQQQQATTMPMQTNEEEQPHQLHEGGGTNCIKGPSTKNGLDRNENQQQQQQRTGQFRKKPITEWTPADVTEWLGDELELAEHCAAFGQIWGHELLHFNRAKYTALGVTRVGDRQKIEQSLKAFGKE